MRIIVSVGSMVIAILGAAAVAAYGLPQLGFRIGIPLLMGCTAAACAHRDSLHGLGASKR